jgi:hypothetical protein
LALFKRALLTLSVTGCVAVFLVALLLVASRQTSPEIWISSMAAIVSIMALGNAMLVFFVAEQRAGFTNAFAIARRWEDEPVRGARNVIRQRLSHIPTIAAAVPNDSDIQLALIHLVNFYWDMASAVETGWTQDGYLRLRFKSSLETIFPAIEALAKVSDDRGINEALNSINRLRTLWAERPSP